MPDRPLDGRHALIESLELIKGSYLKLLVLKQLEDDAFETGRYEELHELAEHERTLVDEINGLMKFSVPDIVAHRSDRLVGSKLAEIDRLQTSVIQKSLGLTGGLRERMARTRKSLDSLALLPKGSGFSRPSVVNIRA